MNLTKPLKGQILAIDDDPSWLEQIPTILEDEAVVVMASTVDEGIDKLGEHYFDGIILDLNFDDDERDGVEVFTKIKSVANGASILVISGETDHKKIIEVFNAGVSKFLPKPVSAKEVRQAIKDILEERARRSRIRSLAESDEAAIVGSSRAIQRVRDQFDRLIENKAKDILILGESGTGKEIATKYIVSRSGAKSYSPIHCGAISESLIESELFGHIKGAFTGALADRIGAFEAARGGFVFLDEIGDMPLSQQVKLLRVLQERTVKRVGCTKEKPVEFRVIAATNRNLQAMVAAGTFREDLYYRISKEIVVLPPLREHKEDIPELVDYFLKVNNPNKQLEFTQEATLLLQKNPWTGNIRELSSVVDRIAARADKVVRPADVAEVLPGLNYKKIGKKERNQILVEREKFRQALLASNYDRDGAAKILGISRATYFRRAKELGLVNERRDRDRLVWQGVGV